MKKLAQTALIGLLAVMVMLADVQTTRLQEIPEIMTDYTIMALQITMQMTGTTILWVMMITAIPIMPTITTTE